MKSFLQQRIELDAPGWWPIILRIIRRDGSSGSLTKGQEEALWEFPHEVFRGTYHLWFADWIIENRIPKRLRETTAFWEV